MKINVGTKNQPKIDAVIDTVKLYPKLFPKPEIRGVEVEIPLFGHPKSVDETIQGAIERARKAFKNCDFSFGIEGGLMKVPSAQTGYMETGACAVFDGKQIYLGLAPAFEWPQKMLDLILSNKADGSQAFKLLGFTKHEKLGAQKGGILGVLTDQRVPREDFTRYSIIMALIQLEKPEYYQ
jgi:inosine/xanthosine triphosphatase